MILILRILKTKTSTYFGLSLISLFVATACSRDSQQRVPLTNSELFSWLEIDDHQRNDFVDNKNKSLKDWLGPSQNLQPVTSWQDNLIKKQEIRRDLEPGNSIELVDADQDQAGKLVLIQGKKRDDLFAVDSLCPGSWCSIIDLAISPDFKHVLVTISSKASTEKHMAFVYDLKIRKLLPSSYEVKDYFSIAWASNDSILHKRKASDDKSEVNEIDINNGQIRNSFGFGKLLNRFSNHYILFQSRSMLRLLDQLTGSSFIVGNAPTEISGYDAAVPLQVSPENVVLLFRNEFDQGEVRRFPRSENPESRGELIIPKDDSPIVSARANEQSIQVLRKRGPSQNLSIYDLNGHVQTVIPIPDCCVITKWSEEIRDGMLQVYLMSAVHQSEVFNYDLAHHNWLEEPASKMLTSNGIQYVSEIQFATSEDGTQVPFRMTRQKSNSKNSRNAILIYSYGGFGAPGFLTPHLNEDNLAFLSRGGIVVGTGIRGGNEYGAEWHDSSIRQNKIKTYQDLAAIAQLLISDKWTTSEKIISTGASNGGLTVAATALLYPGLFGLVIPVAGVYDLLGKNRLDPSFDGWSPEYGSTSDGNAEWLQRLSPLENVAKQKNTEFLIIAGQDDTRVNFVHSLKLAAALDQQGGNPSQVHLLIVKKTGHDIYGGSYSGALTTESVFWTRVFDKSGLNF